MKKKAEKIYLDLQKQYEENGLLPTSFALASAAFGYQDKAIELLNKSCEIKDPALILLALNHKDGKIFYNIPGYNEIRKKMNLEEVHQ